MHALCGAVTCCDQITSLPPFAREISKIHLRIENNVNGNVKGATILAIAGDFGKFRTLLDKMCSPTPCIGSGKTLTCRVAELKAGHVLAIPLVDSDSIQAVFAGP